MNDRSTHPGAAERWALALERGAIRGLEALLTVTFAFIFILVVSLVVLRYVFNSTIVGGNEATVMLFIYTTALGSAVELAHGKHIAIDALVARLPPALSRRLDVFNLIVIAALNAALFVYSLDWIGAVGGSEHPVMHIPEGVVEVAVPIGCALTFIFCVTRIVAALAAKPAVPE
ncbi:TRAP transporter small permease [Shumkonia mesophila]|uniref:TRAP transporter small permease n=1 Tax=Shumkonia mesophila TaxID=2838854 RepID=UPI0029350970|nr:TRAP transporter small permease [Shumkonia mesophila]